MPPPNTPEPSQQPTNRRRPERVVPAIPLGLGKPKSSKPKPKAEVAAKVGKNELTPNPTAAEVGNAQETTNLVANGDACPHATSAAPVDAEATEDAVKMQPTGTPGSAGSGPMSISNGATPDLPMTTSIAPSTPPQTQQPSVTSGPASARKPTDRFNMRPARTELPPLAPTFIPSAEQHTPKSAGSSQSNRPFFYPSSHPVQPSANNIVFGSRESSTSSPVPPPSAGSTFTNPPYGNFWKTQPPYYPPQGHSHHSSEPPPQRMYQPAYAQQAMPWNARNHGQSIPHPQYFQPHGQGFRYPPREVFTPAETKQTNGRSSRSRSASQASSVAPDQPKAQQPIQSPISPDDALSSGKHVFAEPKAAFPGHAHPRPTHFNSQMPPPQHYPHPDVTSSMENAEALRTHILSQFLNPATADCRLQIAEEYGGLHQSVNGHRIIFDRSPTLLMLIRDVTSTSAIAMPTEVNIQLKGPYIRISAFLEALKYLYGGPLLPLDHHRPSSSAGEQALSNVGKMENALCHIATGAWLKLPAVAARGVEVAGGLLHWDTLPTALTFALDGGLSQIWTIEDGSEDRASTSSSDDSLGRPDIAGAPTYDPYSANLLHRVVDFTVHVFPPNFYLDSSAPQLASCPRLPSIPQGHESRKSRSDPRLSQIRFGEIPVEDHQRPSFATTTISSVLLSLPFPLLKCVLEHFELAHRLGSETVASIMRQVVAERETRRNKVFQSRGTGQSDDDVDPQLLQNLYWIESVEPSAQHRAGFRIARRKRDIDTPPSSGACSERNK